MPESEYAKKFHTAIKTIDKLIQDILKGTEKLRKAMRELRESGKDDEDEKGE